MAATKEEYTIKVDQLQEGMFIRLDNHWYKHPFLLNSFKIKDKKHIRTIRESGINEVVYVPQKSDRAPLPPPAESSASSGQTASNREKQDTPQKQEEQWDQKKTRIEELKRIKGEIDKCADKYSQNVNKVSNLMNNVFAGQQEGIENAREVVDEMVEIFLSDSSTVMHLMDSTEVDKDLTYHFLNVSVLSLMIGESAGLEQEDMQTLGLGSLFHDLGKMKIEKKHWRKPKHLMNKQEIQLVQQHPKYGVEILKKAGIDNDNILNIVKQHHEAMNGIGYPQGLKEENISRLSKITTLANIYDNLCNYYDPDKSLPPFFALSLIYKKYTDLVDMNLFSLLVKRLGVYPPGSLVELTNGKLGMVMAVNSHSPLDPLIIVHEPEIPKRDAAIIDMSELPDLDIQRCLSSTELSREAFRYLSPRTRISYYMDNTGDKD